MHQPQYCDQISGEYKLPWSYLHAIKDYVDMAAHLESVPAAKAVVNFAPVLLQQLNDYSTQISGFLSDHKAIRDPLLAALVEPVLPAHPEQRLELINNCMRIKYERVVARFPAYQRLTDLAKPFLNNFEDLIYVSDQLLSGLLIFAFRLANFRRDPFNFGERLSRSPLVLPSELRCSRSRTRDRRSSAPPPG